MISLSTGIGDLSFRMIVTALVIVLLAIDIYVRVMTAVRAYRDEKRRQSQPVETLEEKVLDHDVKLKKDYERLNELEDGSRIMMRAMMAMLSHEISGNSVDKLKKSMDEIQSYLLNK